MGDAGRGQQSQQPPARRGPRFFFFNQGAALLFSKISTGKNFLKRKTNKQTKNKLKNSTSIGKRTELYIKVYNLWKPYCHVNFKPKLFNSLLGI